MDVFKKIDQRISDLDADRKTVEAKLGSDVDRVLAQFEENNFKFKQNEKLFNQLNANVDKAQDDLSAMRIQM